MELIPQDGPVARRLNLHRDWRYDTPLKFLWSVYIYPNTIGGLPELGENIRNVIRQYEIDAEKKWPVDTSGLYNVTERTQFGILIAQNIALPSDSFDINNTSIDGAGGRLGGQYAGNRQGYGSSNKVDITFLETNIDIFDYFIKPWIIANSYKGLIEDGTNKNDLKCSLQLIQYTRNAKTYRGVIGTDKSPNTIRKVINFYDAVPFQVNGDSLSYGDLSINDITKTVSFAFKNYAVVTEPFIPFNNQFNESTAPITTPPPPRAIPVDQGSSK